MELPAVLLIVFNRPDLAERMMARLREVRPARLYIAADGPRMDVATDPARCAQTRTAVDTGIDWPCSVQRRYRNENLGVRHGVVDAINWLFANERNGIILEDDIEIGPDFYGFCSELLDRYENNPQVAAICGTSYLREPTGADYHASSFTDIWGWATWRDRWKDYDGEMRAWPRFRDDGRLGCMPGATPRFVRYWDRIMEACKANQLRAWDYQWILGNWSSERIALHPRVPLVRNVGFGDEATNTLSRRSPSYCRPIGRLSFPLKHPDSLRVDPDRERAMWRWRLNISRWADFIHWLKAPARALRAAHQSLWKGPRVD